jgi:hypothetical protein
MACFLSFPGGRFLTCLSAPAVLHRRRGGDMYSMGTDKEFRPGRERTQCGFFDFASRGGPIGPDASPSWWACCGAPLNGSGVALLPAWLLSFLCTARRLLPHRSSCFQRTRRSCPADFEDRNRSQLLFRPAVEKDPFFNELSSSLGLR